LFRPRFPAGELTWIPPLKEVRKKFSLNGKSVSRPGISYILTNERVLGALCNLIFNFIRQTRRAFCRDGPNISAQRRVSGSLELSVFRPGGGSFEPCLPRRCYSRRKGKFFGRFPLGNLLQLRNCLSRVPSRLGEVTAPCQVYLSTTWGSLSLFLDRAKHPSLSSKTNLARRMKIAKSIALG